MKNRISLLGIIAIVAIIGFGFTACGGDDNTGGGSACNAECLAIGAVGEGGGIIIYHKHSGFTVTGAGSFTAYYLEAAQTDQATSVTWSSGEISNFLDVTGATGTAIGTGKANTAAIIAAHSGDTASNNAAKAAVGCTDGGKNDWFLPSRDELNEMYKARKHLGISSGHFWSSSQRSDSVAWSKNFASDGQFYGIKSFDRLVRAVRAF